MVELVKCLPIYWEFVRQLRCDPRVKDGFIQQGEITPDQQITYMTTHREDYWICLCDHHPAGFVGVVEDDIRVCTHPDFQGRGLGRFMINEVIKQCPKAIAKIKSDNQASLALFTSCGFKPKFILMSHE